MHPHIDSTDFGMITVEGRQFAHDIVIGLDGGIAKRKKKLSKAIYGTSHLVSLAEAEHIYQRGAEALIIGAGQYDNVRLSDEASAFFSVRHVAVDIAPTPEAIDRWNSAKGKVLGLFHVTC